MKRIAGILMPISSLPSAYGIGTLGKAAYRFADFLCASGCSLWQILPLQPTSFGDSPYASCCAGALNPYFIDLDMLADEGLLRQEDYAGVDWGDDPRHVDYGKMYLNRIPVLKKAFARFDRALPEWKAFLSKAEYRDYALFMSLKMHFGGASCADWGEFSEYDEQKAEEFALAHIDEVEFWQFTQYLFLRQWKRLKQYVNGLGIQIMGDIPFYVAKDSVEWWKYKKELFLLDEEGGQAAQAGVPPDAFSDSGQLWGNPVYDWEQMKEGGYAWWHRRIEAGLALYDILRIDHFIGFARYYSIPANSGDARNGQWMQGPGTSLFCGYENRNIVAEDLGVLTDEVRAMVKATGYPGMKILQHAFDGNPWNEHKPSVYTENFYAYTGTHDNETLFTRFSKMQGWERDRMLGDLKSECKAAGVAVRAASNADVCRTVLRLLYASKAMAVVVPLQDVLGMGEESRINSPAVSSGNWSFRFLKSDFSYAVKRRLYNLAIKSKRYNYNKVRRK